MVHIFESHPIQYKVPVYQRLEQLVPEEFEVIFATDCTAKGYQDRDFGQAVAWGAALLEGYRHRVLNNERGVPLSGFRSLTGRGVFRLLRQERPAAVLISQFLYAYDLATFLSCVWLGIPIWIRHETQDEARLRPPLKSKLRALYYWIAYRFVAHAFYVGELNRRHLLRYGMRESQLSFAPYCVPPSRLDDGAKLQVRDRLRAELGVLPREVLLLFSGKLIEKKNPQLLLEALALLPPPTQARLKIVYVGSGTLGPLLEEMAARFPGRVNFTGFIKQERLPDYYLAADILMLPSRRQGETWGLVVNEALEAGCSVIVSEAVGCAVEFGRWERVRVIPVGDAAQAARAVDELSALPRSLDWCRVRMEEYSIDAAAKPLAAQINALAAHP